MPQDPLLAYSLSQVDGAWRWSVYDEDGLTVADGANVDRGAAEAAVASTLRAPQGLVGMYGG